MANDAKKGPTTCGGIIASCRKALDAKDKEIQLSDLAIKAAKDDNTRLNKEVEKKNDQLSSIFRNPFVLIGAGIIAGLFLAPKVFH